MLRHGFPTTEHNTPVLFYRRNSFPQVRLPFRSGKLFRYRNTPFVVAANYSRAFFALLADPQTDTDDRFPQWWIWWKSPVPGLQNWQTNPTVPFRKHPLECSLFHIWKFCQDPLWQDLQFQI